LIVACYFRTNWYGFVSLAALSASCFLLLFSC
jgi:hypothetical protein